MNFQETQGPETRADPPGVNDKRFMSGVHQLIQLRDFLSREGVWPPNPAELGIAKLEALIFDSGGRPATIVELDEVRVRRERCLSY